MSIDKLQQAIIYNARKNEVEHKQLTEKISDVSNSINEVYEKTITSDNQLSERIERFDDKLNEVSQAIDDIELLEPEKGEKGDKGDKGDRGDKGERGIDGIDGIDGKDGLDGKDGKDGKDGSPDTGEEIVKKINAQNEKIDYSKIKNIPAPKVEIREIHNGTIGTGIETIKSNGTTISNSTKSLNFVNATVTRDSDNVSVTINDPDLTAYLDKATYDPADGAKQVAFAEDVSNTNELLNLLNQFNTAYPTCYSEIDYTDELPTTITYYEDNTKTTTLYTKTITYTSGLPTTVTIVDNVNSKTLTITNTYTDGVLTSVTKAIS